MPLSRALFGYDVVGSSSHQDDELEDLRLNAARQVADAFAQAGVETDGRANYSPTGDGALAVYPESSLPALIDAMQFLDRALYRHNRKHLPQIRLRASVHTAPVRITEGENFQRGTIELARVLDAAPLKEIVRRMGDYRPPTVALIASDQAFKVAVQGRYTEWLRPDDFATVEVKNKEFTERCWVHVPGLDAERVRELVSHHPSTPPVAQPRNRPPATQHITGAVQGGVFGGDNHGGIVIGDPGPAW
jgi:class 3 adenylate cyclase